MGKKGSTEAEKKMEELVSLKVFNINGFGLLGGAPGNLLDCDRDLVGSLARLLRCRC